MRHTYLFGALILATVSHAQTPAALKPFLSAEAPYIVLNHVRIIDGTGAPPQEDRRIDIARGVLVRIDAATAKPATAAGALVLDLTGKTVIPGLVGMHEHLFYPAPERRPGHTGVYGSLLDSGPRLYLAAGVTSARTAGTMEPYADLGLKRMIDEGQTPGPKLYVTGPYLGDYEQKIPQMRTVSGPEDVARMVDYWADAGVTSFKAYMYLKPEELKAAIEHAHARGLKITGHLCAVGFTEAAALGIDNLEHGLIVDTEFDPAHKPGVCAAREAEQDLIRNLEIDSAPVREMIRQLVSHHVAITSTLAVFETFVANRPPLKQAQGQGRP